MGGDITPSLDGRGWQGHIAEDWVTWEILLELTLENRICGDSIEGTAIVSLASHNLYLRQQVAFMLIRLKDMQSSECFPGHLFPMFFPFSTVADSLAQIPCPDTQPACGAGLKHLLREEAHGVLGAPSLLTQLGLPPSLSPLISLTSLLVVCLFISLCFPLYSLGFFRDEALFFQYPQKLAVLST